MRATVALSWVLASAVLLPGCSSGADERVARPGSAASPAGPATVSLSCDGAVRLGALPEWARTGFSPPDQAVRYVIGQHRSIVGVVFGYPLEAPASSGGRNNKILWVSHAARAGAPPDLEIVAHRDGSSQTVQRTIIGGPGPSIVDMPEPGCWTFDLTWSGVHDRLAVPYGP